MASGEESVNSSLVAATQQERRPRPAKRRTQKYSEKEEKYPTRIGTKNDPCPWHLTRHRPAEYRAQYGEEPPEANKKDPEFDKWKQKRRPKKDVAVPELYCKQDGTLNLCRECFLHWLLETKPGKGHTGGLFCCHERHKKHKSHKKAKQREENQPAKRHKAQGNLVGSGRDESSDANSSASGTTNVIKENNMSGCDFERALRICETRNEQSTEQPTDRPPIKPTVAGIMLDEPEAEVGQPTNATDDLMQVNLGEAELTYEEKEAQANARVLLAILYADSD